MSRLPSVSMPNDEKKVISRDQAIAAGAKSYFTGLPCVNGHIDERLTINAQCKSCAREGQQRHREKIRRLVAEAKAAREAAAS